MIGLHALAVVAVGVATFLGFWQLGAWQQHRAMAAVDVVDEAPVPLDSILGPDQPFPNDAVGRPVRVRGQWLPGSTLLVENRFLDGRRGLWVVTPVAVCAPGGDCANAPAVLVVRGFTDDAGPLPPPPTGRTVVTGWAQPGEGSGGGDDDPTDDRIPELRIADAIQHVDQDLYSGYVVARTLTPGRQGLAPVTPDSLPAPSVGTGLRNLLYAIEWWVFAAFFGFLWWRWCSDEVSRVSAAAAAAEDAQPAPVPSRP
jgi:cytochrome oxidase assembly protein ShyY1